MPLLSAYTNRDTFLHRLDPRTKLVWLAAMLAVSFATSQIAALGGLLVIALGSCVAARVDLRSFVPMVRVVGGLAICVLLVQSIVRAEGEVFFRVGAIAFHADGLWLAVQVILRLCCVVVIFLQFLMWTHPTDLSLVLVKVGLPYRYAMLIGLTLRFLPVMEEELAKIFEVQAARGVALEGPVRKALAFGPIFLPFCLRALRRANEVALAMELRAYGFRPRRTFLREIRYRRADWLATLAILIGVAAYFFTLA